MPKCGAGLERRLVGGKHQGAGFSIVDQAGGVHEPQQGGTQCIETYNANGGLSTLKERLICTTALVLIAQETGITPELEGDASVWAAGAGWHMLHTPAEDRGGGHTSAGVACFARLEVGLRGLTVLVEHRMLAVKIDLPAWPELDLVGAYFKVNEGIGPVNVAMLSAAKAYLEHTQHSMLAADWNMAPRQVEDTGLPRLLDSVLVVPKQHTCRTKDAASHIDFFMASSTMAGVLDTITCDLRWEKRPHRPVQFCIRQDALVLKQLAFRSHSRLPTLQAYGPRLPHLDWSGPLRMAQAAAQAALKDEVIAGQLKLNDAWVAFTKTF